MTHDADHWYFAQQDRLWRIPVSHPLDEPADPSLSVSIPQELLDLGVEHLGALDHHDGKLLVPLEGGAVGRIGVFRATDLEYAPLSVARLAQGPEVPWCAIEPRSGLLFSSPFDVDQSGLYAYRWSWDEGNGLEVDFVGRFPLTRDGQAYTPRHVQGGVISSRGHLYLVCDDGTGVHGFDLVTGELVLRLHVDYRPEDLLREELEGIALFDLSGGEAPSIEGQLHVVMIRNGPPPHRVYFKHYEVHDPADRQWL